MVTHCRFRIFPVCGTLPTQRLVLKVFPFRCLPFVRLVELLCHLVSLVHVVLLVGQLLMFRTIPPIRQVGTAWVAARSFWLVWHNFLQKKNPTDLVRFSLLHFHYTPVCWLFRMFSYANRMKSYVLFSLR